VEGRRRQDRTSTQPLEADLLDPVVRVAGDAARVPSAMRGVWRRSAASADLPADSAGVKRPQLLDWLSCA